MAMFGQDQYPAIKVFNYKSTENPELHLCLSERFRDEYARSFRAYDRQNIGCVALSEFHSLRRHVGIFLDHQEKDTMMSFVKTSCCDEVLKQKLHSRICEGLGSRNSS